MAREIDILYKDNIDNGIFGAKVYIGTKDGKLLYDKNKSAITSPDGIAKLNVTSMPLISQYVWLKDPNSNYESKQLYRSSKKSPYTFIKKGKTQDIVETIVVGKRPTKKEPKKEPKKNLFPLYLFGFIGIGIIGFVIYQKNKRKSGS